MGLDEDAAYPVNIALAVKGVEFRFSDIATYLTCQQIHNGEAHVVTGQIVFGAGVAQTHQQVGDGGGGGSGLALLQLGNQFLGLGVGLCQALILADHQILDILLGTGLRVSECVGLNLDDIDFTLLTFLI